MLKEQSGASISRKCTNKKLMSYIVYFNVNKSDSCCEGYIVIYVFREYCWCGFGDKTLNILYLHLIFTI